MADRPFAYVCSPLRGNIEANMARAREYCRQVYEAGYNPIAVHLYYPQFLNDNIPAERAAGMEMGTALLARCSALVICGDRVSEGMAAEIKLAKELNIPTVPLDLLTAAERINSNDRSFDMSENGTSAPPGADDKYPISAYICNAEGGLWHGFPTTTEKLQDALKSIDAYSGEIIVNNYNSYIKPLAEVLESFLSVNFDELNYLAAKLDGMAESRLELFAAVLETRRHCDDVNSLINILENHYCFNLDPVSSLNEYGDYLADRECDEYAGLVKKLAKSSDPEMQEFAAYISRLEKSLDTESYAKTRAEEENGSFTEHGYLTEGNGFTEIYHGPEDIPAEYRVFDYLELDPFIKVENTDLSVLLLKMHALGGSYMPDAGFAQLS